MSFSPSTTAPLNRAQIARYACAVGDFNPIHVDEDFARNAGMPSVIAHGPLTASLVLDVIAREIGIANLRSYEIRLSAPVFPGDELTVDPDGQQAVVRKADGTVAAKVTFEVSG